MSTATGPRVQLRDNEGDASRFWICTAADAARAETIKGHVEKRRDDLHREEPGATIAIDGIAQTTDRTLATRIELNGAGQLNPEDQDR